MVRLLRRVAREAEGAIREELRDGAGRVAGITALVRRLDIGAVRFPQLRGAVAGRARLAGRVVLSMAVSALLYSRRGRTRDRRRVAIRALRARVCRMREEDGPLA
jgi:hypothetical protein